MTANQACVFCALLQEPDRQFDICEPLWVAFKPIGPVNTGHRLLIPRRHMEMFTDLNEEEGAALPRTLARLRYRTGAIEYNLGVNAGPNAGQTVFHLHVHLIPRVADDVPDPRGGIITPLGEQLEGSQFADYLRSAQ